MSRRRGANHQRRLRDDPSWRPVNLLVDLLRFAVFILDVIVSMNLMIIVKCQLLISLDFVIKHGHF